MPDAATPDAPTPAMPPAVPPLKAGFLTSENAITFLVAILAALPSSGLLPVGSIWIKLAGLAVSGFVALGYQSQRTKLKIAHLEATRALHAARAPSSRL